MSQGFPPYGQPPSPYGPPPAPYGPPPGMQPYARLAAITERSSVTVLLLSLVTCGVYYFIWKYQTTVELKEASGDASLNPGLDIVLSIVLCGIWAIYTD